MTEPRAGAGATGRARVAMPARSRGGMDGSVHGYDLQSIHPEINGGQEDLWIAHTDRTGLFQLTNTANLSTS